MVRPTQQEFITIAESARRKYPGCRLAVPLCLSLLDDQLTPVLAYRRLVAPDAREAPSFLFESVEGGERQGRYSILGAQPVLHVVSWQGRVRISAGKDRQAAPERLSQEPNPLDVPRRLTADLRLVVPGAADQPTGAKLPRCFLGGWVGFAGYDTVRYVEPVKLPFAAAPKDDRGLPDMHFAYYDGVVAFDHVDKLVHVVQLAEVAPDAGSEQVKSAWEAAAQRLRARASQLQTHSKPLPSGSIADAADSPKPMQSNLTRPQHAAMVGRAMEYIKAGDIFQVVIGQRFERQSDADPFDVYRALRTVNPSPYMVYMQAEGCVLVASSPEILCRVRQVGDGGFEVTNRPLAGTRKRGRTPDEDAALERDLLADPKERAEHTMLVDLGRNDLGVVCEPGSIALPAVMHVERYSHVMHISSTVTGRLRAGLDCWDALRATLPVGTISGAPKIRAMQIIDELEPCKRGPYGGGIGCVGLNGEMDIALALRTMVVPISIRSGGRWTYHVQAAGGIVADSQAEAEFQETVNKAAALGRAIELAERAFTPE